MLEDGVEHGLVPGLLELDRRLHQPRVHVRGLANLHARELLLRTAAGPEGRPERLVEGRPEWEGLRVLLVLRDSLLQPLPERPPLAVDIAVQLLVTHVFEVVVQLPFDRCVQRLLQHRGAGTTFLDVRHERGIHEAPLADA
eukprot:196541-Pyramimonas_sp.AAC.2